MRVVRFLLAVLVAALSLPAFGGSMYQWTDQSGVIHFSDAPIHGQPTIELDQRTPAGKPAQPSSQDADPTGTGTTAMPPAGEENPASPDLKKYEIPYIAQEGRAQRIIVQVTFNGTTTVPIAIDTGSPDTVISFDLAGRLGLLKSEAGRLWVLAGGIGGEVPALYTIIDTIQLGEAQRSFLLTTVTAPLSDAFDGVVGMDFLSAYSTQVDPKKKLFVLQELPPETGLYGGHDESWWRAQFRVLGGLRKSWRMFRSRLDDAISRSKIVAGRGIDEAKLASTFAAQQSQEADKLFDKLNHYAIQLAVPMPWREY